MRKPRLTMKQKDVEFEDLKIASVTPPQEGSDYWDITRDDGWSIGFRVKTNLVPKVGDTIRFYGMGIGYPVRGIDINGEQIRYRTPKQHAYDQKRMFASWHNRDRRWFEKNKAKQDAKIAALPEVFQARIKHFQEKDPDFRVKGEPYELFIYEQAVVIAEALKTEEAIAEWRDLTWEEQKARVPGLDDGHSGNTFAAAAGLARAYVTDPRLVWNDEYAKEQPEEPTSDQPDEPPKEVAAATE